MEIWYSEVTDARSVRIRFVYSLISSVVCFLPLAWLSASIPLTVTMAVVFSYVSVVELIMDCWRLRHRDAPIATERRLRLLAALPALTAVPLALFLLR